jgi:hypothetical protein
MLQFFSSSTGMVHSGKAIKYCLETALASENDLSCDLLVIHASIGHDFQELLQEANALCPGAVIVGCTGAGVVGKEGSNEQMRGLAIMAVKAHDKSEFAVAYCENIRGYNSYEQAEIMAKTLKSQNDQVNMIMLLASGIDIAADQAIKGIESVFGGDIPIFGGTSSDNSKAISSFQFFNQEILERGAVVVGFADPTLELISGANHGNVPIGMPFTVTKSESNQVFELDGEDAWPFLMNKLDLPASTHPGQTIPIAGLGELIDDSLVEEYGNKLILRVIVKISEDHKSFYMPVDCPVGTQLWLTKRDEARTFEGLDVLIKRIKNQIGDRNLAAVFHTDCVARGRQLFNKIEKEEIIRNMQEPLAGDKDIPWLGMYGFGEFTLLGGKNYFHNYTTSIYALVRA